MSKNDQRYVTKHNITKGRIVTILKQEEKKNYFPCPICDRKLLIKYSIKAKPYCVCNLCGVQLFIRGEDGIKKLKKILNDNT